MGHIIVHVYTVDSVPMYVPIDAQVLPISPAFNPHYTTIEIDGEIPEGAEESLEEIALEEALARAMAKRQGD